MIIENLKQIAIKYASIKGSRIPLAPDELCNAVVQYMNSFFGVMTNINTIKVAVTEDSGNIVFTITGNTYDGKPITPIVITVDHNDFVTDQEFEEFKTTTNAAIQKNTESINSLSFRVEDTENDITTIQVQVGQINTRVGNTETDVTNLKNRVDNTETNIAEINITLLNKVDKVTSTGNFNRLYKISDTGQQGTVNYSDEAYSSTMALRDGYGRINVAKGVEQLNGANMQNIADVEAKIPDVSGFATKDDIMEVKDIASSINSRVDNVESDLTAEIDGKLDKSTGVTDYAQIYVKMADGSQSTVNTSAVTIPYSIPQRTSSGRMYAEKGLESEPSSVANMRNIADVEAKIPDTSSFVTLAGDNTFGGTNTFNNSIYAKNGVVAGDTTNYGANSVTKGSNTYSFPNKSGTFAMTTDIIKNPIYFISFYANEPSEPCHLIGTMMSKNLYGTGQKTNEEFAVMLADNLYTNSNEGLAAYGKLAEKDILCIYSEDGLSIRCLNEENSEVDLPTVIFFVMETEL